MSCEASNPPMPDIEIGATYVSPYYRGGEVGKGKVKQVKLLNRYGYRPIGHTWYVEFDRCMMDSDYSDNPRWIEAEYVTKYEGAKE